MTAVILSGCTYTVIHYDEADFIGKTSSEIIYEYGAFDCITLPADEDGIYRGARCGYTIQTSQKGFWGSSPEKIFFITFDENGIAVECKIGHRPGG